MTTEVRPRDVVQVEKLVEHTGKDFTDGVWSRYFTYFNECQGRSLCDRDMYAFLVQNILDVRGNDLFNTGYCTGWIEALLEDRNIFAKR
jgi:hypothetical protein